MNDDVVMIQQLGFIDGSPAVTDLEGPGVFRLEQVAKYDSWWDYLKDRYGIGTYRVYTIQGRIFRVVVEEEKRVVVRAERVNG
jgi:hypothetical protein